MMKWGKINQTVNFKREKKAFVENLYNPSSYDVQPPELRCVNVRTSYDVQLDKSRCTTGQVTMYNCTSYDVQLHKLRCTTAQVTMQNRSSYDVRTLGTS